MQPLLILLQAAAAAEATEVADSTLAQVVGEATKDTIEYIVNTPASELIPELLNKALSFGLKILAALLIYLLGAWLIKVLKRFMNKMFTKRSTDKAVASFISSLVGITLMVLLILLSIGILGINTTSIAALLAAGGMAIGMALSGTVQNFAGGIMLLVFKPFKTGDYITAQGYSGTVTHMSIVSTTITTVDNRCIVLPNGALSSGTIDNYSQNDLRRVDWTVDVSYGSDSQKVIETLMAIVESDPRVLHVETGAPAEPFVALSNLADSSIQFTVRVWVKQADYWGVFFDGNKKIYEGLPKKGIEFPFPQLDVHVKQN